MKKSKPVLVVVSFKKSMMLAKGDSKALIVDDDGRLWRVGLEYGDAELVGFPAVRASK